MDKKSGRLDFWRNHFRSANSDIFEVIENAILVAASDCPQEFRIRRDIIAERLFSCRLTRCIGCDHVEIAVPHEGEVGENGGFKGGYGGEGCGKESKMNSSTNERPEMNRASNYSYDEAEALTEEIEEESQIVAEVLRIKEVLGNHQEESSDVLFESLRRLQLMRLTVETLKATEIGKAVNGLRKHGLKQIRVLARTLIDGWKDLVDEWVNTVAAISGGTPESVNPNPESANPTPESVDPFVMDEEEGLPFPPLDEGALFATQTTMELSQFFEGMDDDGNPQNNGEFNKNCEIGRNPGSENFNRKRKQQALNEANVPKDDKNQIRKQETKQAKPSTSNFGPGRPPKLSSDHKATDDINNSLGVQKKPSTGQQDKSIYSDDHVRLKLEASGRNLQERYQQHENAKRQRTIQVMELRDLPKQGPSQRNSHMKSGIHNRQWANGRR